MIGNDTLSLIEDNVKQILDPLGFVLVELKGVRSSDGMILRFLIDRIEGGITIKECSDLNRQIGQLIDEKGIVSERCVLEVSSPGMDRPLVDSRDFKRVLNRRIHVSLKEAEQEKLEFEGNLVKLDNKGIFLADDKGREQFVSFLKINKAKQVI